MNVCIIGPSSLSSFDKDEISAHINDLVKDGHTINLLAYRSIEVEVFKYFIENLEINPNIANQLKIYSFQPLTLMPEKIKMSIEFLMDEGVQFQSFNITPLLMNEDYFIRRLNFVEGYRNIIKNCDLTVCFYDGKKSTLMIPVDISKELNIEAIVYRLPNEDETLFNLSISEKVTVHKNS